jgi:hypothetical protein
MNHEFYIINMEICNTICNNCYISCSQKPIFLRECGHSFCIECSIPIFGVCPFIMNTRNQMYIDYNSILKKWELTCPLHEKWKIRENMSMYKNMCKIKTICSYCNFY